MIYPSLFFLALGINCLVEIPILWFCLRTVLKMQNVPVTRIVFTGILANALSLPYLWFVLPSFLGGTYFLPIGELIVIAIEGVVLNQLLRTRPGTSLALSAVMNTVSFLAGWWVVNL
ncbi:hypothetical protein [Methanoregula sp.]|uniref:hypothetical protein n=1 Tax=Methanoregula sp. TaxID=2052170 RepID=UPI002C4659BC|nr:hypothetical protein [Methanoregula sp.]HVP96785.1 hypothetical protein [Methanoregula sp.]